MSENVENYEENLCREESLKYGENAGAFMSGACDNFLPDGGDDSYLKSAEDKAAYWAGYNFADKLGNVE